LRALDLTIERMGLGSGPTVDELVAELRPLIKECDPDVSEDNAEQIASLVIDELLNEQR
jgi:hypothetical protein